MAKQATPKQFAEALALHKAGRSMKEILEKTGLNYSQAWLHVTDATMPDSERLNGQGATLNRQIAESRKKGNSWGYIAVQARLPESRVRKLYEEATNTRSIGQRIGKGGRFLADDELIYRPDPAKGVTLKRGEKVADARRKAHEALVKQQAKVKAADERKKARAAQPKPEATAEAEANNA